MQVYCVKIQMDNLKKEKPAAALLAQLTTVELLTHASFLCYRRACFTKGQDVHVTIHVRFFSPF